MRALIFSALSFLFESLNSTYIINVYQKENKKMKKSNVIFTIVVFAIVISVIVFKLTGRMEILKNRYNPVEDTECSEHVESTEPSEDETTSEPTVNAVESKEKPVEINKLDKPRYTYLQEETCPYEDVTESLDSESVTTYYELTYDEIDMLARLVYLEAGGESYECMKGVASVVLNRMTSTGMSLHDVIYAPNQFSPACYIESTCYTDTVYSAVMDVVENGPSLPTYVTFFRADYYHDFGNDIVVPYTCINNTYFSADTRLMEG